MSVSLNQKKYMGEKYYSKIKLHEEGSFDTKMNHQKKEMANIFYLLINTTYELFCYSVLRLFQTNSFGLYTIFM